MKLVMIMTPISLPGTLESETLENHQPPPDASPYPDLLMQEYHALTDKKLRRTITAAERTRLQEVRDHIAVIDAQRARPDTWDIQAQKLREELAQLRTEVEALPDAPPAHK